MYPASGDDIRSDSEIPGDRWANVNTTGGLTGILSGVPSAVTSYAVSGQGGAVTGVTSGYSS